MMHGCLFCDLQLNDRARIIADNELVYVVRDGYPVRDGHTLVIPKRHAVDYFHLLENEVLAINELLLEQRRVLTAADPTIEGFNVGMNCGAVAGQSVFHCHVHLIPRRRGDVAEPRGGVRNVIPGRGNY